MLGAGTGAAPYPDRERQRWQEIYPAIFET